LKRYLLWLVLMLSLSANATVLAISLRNRVAHPEMPLLSKVELAPEQRARIMELRGGFLAFRQANHERASTLRGQLADLLKADPPDASRIDESLHAISENQGALQRRVVDHVLAVRAVLRPDQRPTFHDLMTEQLRAGGPMQGACVGEVGR
jgi:Spy/CpxP family protein refolding chaperone